MSRKIGQTESSYAGIILSHNLDSIDILDLIYTAIYFYDKLTPNFKDKIGVSIYPKFHTKQERMDIIYTNFKQLSARFNRTLQL